MDQNIYASSKANLNAQRGGKNDEVTPQIIAFMISAGTWARVISWASIIGLVLLAIAIIVGIVLLFQMPGMGVLIIAGSAIFLWLNWVIYTTMRDYANAAKNLNFNDGNAIENVEECFIKSNIYFKWTSIFTIVMFFVGILVALFMPNNL